LHAAVVTQGLQAFWFLLVSFLAVFEYHDD